MPMEKVAHVDMVSEFVPVRQVHGDALQIQKAITNVLENAVKHSPFVNTILIR